MDKLGFLIAGLFYIASFSCILIGIYFVYINSYLNKLVFLLCSSLSCWCLGVASSLIASNLVDSMVWKRFEVIGVITFYGFILHYIIILAERDNLVMKKWIHFVIYIPVILSVYFFAISTDVTQQLYHLKKTEIGWITMPVSDVRVIYFYLFIISYLLIGLYLIHQWRGCCNDEHKKKQVNLIMISYAMIFMGSVMNQMLNNLKINGLFQEIVPFIFIFPILSFGFIFKKHNFVKSTIVNDVIFIDNFRTKIIKYLSLSFCFGAIIFLISEYLHDRNVMISKVVSLSCLLVLFGVCIYCFQRYSKNQEFKMMLYSILLSISIPVITLYYINYASITVWAFPFLIIIATLLFNNSAVTMVSTSIIMTELYMWIKVPHCLVMVNESDFFVRISLFGIAICFVNYVNKIYLLRMNQLNNRIRTQDLLFFISSSVIDVNNDNIKKKMDEILKLLCEYVKADRAHIYYNVCLDDSETKNYYYWCNNVGQLDGEILQDTSISECTWWKKVENENGVIQIFDVSDLPKEAIKEKEILMNQNVKSTLSVPLYNHDQRVGFLRIDYVSQLKKWDDELIKTLMIVGNILGAANIKVNSEKVIHQMAYYDQLTNIPNRQLFNVRIKQAIKKAQHSGKLLGIIFLNVDSFKMVNDTIGHQFGDKMLVMIADKLTKCLRKTDTVCRFAGDEFLIMLCDTLTKRDIETVAKKIIKQFDEPLLIEEQEFYITASIGISVFPMDGMDKDTLIKNADLAMYNAKSNGKNQFLFCSEKMKEEIQKTVILTNYLYHALEQSELYIVYQPQISIESGKVIAVEVLTRWNQPDLGNVPPSIFIPIAEHIGLINTIGEWILKEACKQNKIWQDMGLPPIRIAVNVSVNQLLNPEFSNKVNKILQETQMDPVYLELEITENIAIQEFEYIIDVLNKLKAIGISLAIDDFGIEYSSLSRIKLLPVDRIKIDMHFITGILNDEKDRAIVDSIIKLAKDLNLKVIAEGVEKEEQLNYLEKKNCDEVQGFYFYKPLSKDKMEEVLNDYKEGVTT